MNFAFLLNLVTCVTGPGAANIADNTNCDGLSTGINTNSKTENTLYPNPANDKVSYRLGKNSGIVTVLIYDFTGKQIVNNAISNATETIDINTSELANGVYIIRIKTSDKTVTKKLTVLHR